MKLMRYCFCSLFILFVISCQQERSDHESKQTDPSPSIDQFENNAEENVQDESLIPVFDLSYVMGKFDPSTHVDFDSIELKYADRSGMFLRKDAYTDFKRMYDAAQKEGIRLQIRSAARNFDYQKGIWERKWNGETKIESGKDASVAYPNPVDRAKQILLYSSMPGTSRHHWGTDIDLNSFDNDWFKDGKGSKLYLWLVEHAHEYGYCQPYTDKTQYERSGYEEERWHWSYMPISKPLTLQAKKLLKNEMITGFLGSEVAPIVNMVDHYVLGIHPYCLSNSAPVTK